MNICCFKSWLQDNLLPSHRCSLLADTGWMFSASPPLSLHVEMLMTMVIVVGGGTSGWLGRDTALRNGVCIIKDTPQSSLASSTMWGPRRSLLLRRELSPDSDHAGALFLDFQPLALQELKFCCLQTTQSVMFCYRSLNRLRHWASVDTKMELITQTLFWGRIECDNIENAKHSTWKLAETQ